MQITAKKTKVDLITGFLGAGKTTFILDYAKELLGRGERIGIIENDFGAINVDLMLLHRELGDRCRLEMVIGGDPDCHRRRLKTKLIAMGIDRYDRVIVEPSGVFDVEEFSDILYEEPLDHLLELNNVITVADGEMLAAEAYSESGRYLLAEQLTKAGRVLISKTEKLGADQTGRQTGGRNESDNGEDQVSCMGKILRYMNESLEGIGCARRLRPEDLILRRDPGVPKDDGKEKAVTKDTAAGTSDGQNAGRTEERFTGIISAGDWDHLLSAGHRDYAYRKQQVIEDGAFSSLFFFHPELPEEPVEELMRRIFADPACAGLMRVKGFVKCSDPSAQVRDDSSVWLEINATREHTELRTGPVGQPVLIAIGEGISQEVIGSYLKSYENEYRA